MIASLLLLVILAYTLFKLVALERSLKQTEYILNVALRENEDLKMRTALLEEHLPINLESITNTYRIKFNN